MISTWNLKLLPDIDKLYKICNAIKLITLIINKFDFDFFNINDNKIFSFDQKQGYFLRVLFNKDICMVYGFDNNSGMSPIRNNGDVWFGILELIPENFRTLLIHNITEKNINFLPITYCVWREKTDSEWRIGEIIYSDNEFRDGSEMMSIFDSRYFFKMCLNNLESSKYLDENDIYLDQELVDYFFNYNPLNNNILKKINPYISLYDIKYELNKIDYPIDDKQLEMLF
ncbi:MAG: hypothetical protein U0354_20115 [Candidatus Sericytochromatia bacterium]